MRARVFNIMQYEYNPKDGYADPDLDEPKPGATPMITQAAIDDGLSHRSIKRWAYIWHDKDMIHDDGEGTDVGHHKHRHAHIVLQCASNVELSAIAKWFSVPENFIDVPKGRGAFLDCVEYLTHESEKEQAKGKHLYSDDEVHANFDFRAELIVRNERRAKYGPAADGLTPAKEMKLRVLKEEAYREGFKAYSLARDIEQAMNVPQTRRSLTEVVEDAEEHYKDLDEHSSKIATATERLAQKDQQADVLIADLQKAKQEQPTSKESWMVSWFRKHAPKAFAACEKAYERAH